MEETREMQGEGEKAALLPEETKREEEGKRKMKVMVAVDESEVSLYALKWALNNLLSIKESETATTTGEGQPQVQMQMQVQVQAERVMIVHVIQPFQSYVFPAGPSVFATSSIVESVRKAQEENAASVVSRALQICKQKMIKAETVLVEGDPKDMICEVAEKMNIDLLVVGSRGLGKIKRAFLGSVSDYCAQHAKCPILIVKPPKEKHHHKT